MKHSNFINIKVNGKRIRRFVGNSRMINTAFSNSHKSKIHMHFMNSDDGFIINPHREKSINTKVIGETKIYKIKV
tara:strand:- start:34 stop:258 length:225 start_codon:yes stop_codon:yes gene_type:complete